MKNLKTVNFKNISYKYIIYCSILVLITILILMFSLYTYYNYQKECEETAGRESQYTAERVVNQLDERLNSMRQYYLSSMSSDEITWILENDLQYSDYSHYKAAQNVLSNKMIFSDYINSYTFVNFQTNWVLSNKGMFPLDETINYDVLYDLFENDNLTYGKNYWIYDSAIGIENTIDREYRLTVETGGLSLVMELPTSKLNTYGMLIVNINMNTWKGWIKEWLNECEDVVVIDSEGEIIYTSDENLVDSCRDLQIQGGASTSAMKVTAEGGTVYMTASHDSDILGWEYYIFYNLKEGQFAGLRLSGIFMILFALLLFTVFITVTYFIYRPIGRLLKNVTDESQKIQGNELNYLANRFANLKDDKQVLEAVVQQQRSRLQELFELRLIRGEVRSSDEWDEYFEGLHLPYHKYFATAVMVLDLRDEGVEQGSVNEDAICLKLIDEVPEDLRKLIWMPLVYNICTIFCVFGEEEEDKLLENIMKFYTGIQQFTEEHYGFHILMGVSTTHTSLQHIHAAYRESINALTITPRKQIAEESGVNDSASNNEESCHFYLASAAIKGSTHNNRYEKNITKAIKAVDKDQCYEVVDDFSMYLNNINNQEEAVIYILHFVNTILITAIDARLNLNLLYPDGLNKLYRQLVEVMEISRIRRYIKHILIDPILLERTRLLDKKSYSVMEEIERMIIKTKGNITLTECAEALDVHTTYIWKVLKMEKGKSFIDYLEEYKIEEAKRLLLQTDMTVAEIAVEMNYTNAQNFIRFFSKSTGVTPGKFRKLF